MRFFGMFPNGTGVSFLKWFYPGMQVKRWLLLIMAGVAVVGLGLAYLLREMYVSYTFPTFFWYITLQFLPRYVRGVLFLGIGIVVILVAIWRLNSSLLSVFVPKGREESLVDLIYQHRQLQRGPKVVAIGGGTGLSTLLRGLKDYTGNLTAIVTVADDGGSSGRLRRELGVLPPGDFRNCIAALADAEPLMTQLLQYRFSEGSGLEGHSFGNLFIVAMSGVTGSFEKAIRESCRVLAVRGQILPSTLANITLSARMEDEMTVRGESNITKSGKKIKQVYLEPEGDQAYSEATQAILEADLIILGPGSLYTSVLPNLLVHGIAESIRASSAAKVYVCNVATERGETDGYTVEDHVEAIHRHVNPGLFQFVIANGYIRRQLPPEWGVEPVYFGGTSIPGIKTITAEVSDSDNPLHHDPHKLCAAIFRLFYSKERESTDSKAEVVASR